MSHRTIFAVVLAVDIAAVVAALALGKRPDYYFGEKGFITKLSFVQLLLIAGVAATIYQVRKRATAPDRWRRPVIIWPTVALGFLFLAIDDLAGIHEQMDALFHRLVDLSETPLSDRLDDMIVAGYGVIGIIILYLCRAEIRQFRDALPLLIAGFVLMFLMVAADVISARNGVIRAFVSSPETAKSILLWMKAVEDSLKLFAEAAFIGAAWHCLEIARRIPRQQTT